MECKDGNDDSDFKGGGSSGTQNVLNPIGNINPNARITMEFFNGKNYREWSYLAKMAFGGAKCFGYISGRIKEPSKDDPKYKD